MYEKEDDYSSPWERKHHYWRGFRSGVIVMTVPLAAFMWAANVGLSCLMGN